MNIILSCSVAFFGQSTRVLLRISALCACLPPRNRTSICSWRSFGRRLPMGRPTCDFAAILPRCCADAAPVRWQISHRPVARQRSRGMRLMNGVHLTDIVCLCVTHNINTMQQTHGTPLSSLHHHQLPILPLPRHTQAIRMHESTAPMKLAGAPLPVVILAIRPEVLAAAVLPIVLPLAVVPLI